MNHSYIFAEGHWKAVGHYYDYEANQIEVFGETTIKHLEAEWVLDGFMELKLENPIRLYNKYSIAPLPDKKDYTRWTSQNPALGKLMGYFMIVGDTILSSYISENALFSGSESLIQIADTKYLNRGFAFKGDNKLSSWEVTLERVMDLHQIA